MKNYNRKGFTLIELLVVILIIGILASIAVPQYFKAVEKARVGEATTTLASIRAAADRYKANQSTYPTSFGKLDIVYKNASGSNITGTSANLKYYTIEMSASGDVGSAKATRNTSAPTYGAYVITINYVTGVMSITCTGAETEDCDSLIDK